MLNDKAQSEKYLRAMRRELDRLRLRRNNPPAHPLIPPIQRGWKRHFVMTPAARLRPDAATLETILGHLNTVQYFWRPDFRHSRRQRSRRRGLVSIEQELVAVRSCEWEKGLVTPAWRKYFRLELLPVERLPSFWPQWERKEFPYPQFAHPERRGYEWGYAFRFAALIELKVEKHWLTHYTEIEPGVAGRIAEIERWMEFHRGYERFNRLKGKSWNCSHRNQSAWRREERRIQRETRAHLGFLGNEAADRIPSIKPCGGHGGWDVFSRLGSGGRGSASADRGVRASRNYHDTPRTERLRDERTDTEFSHPADLLTSRLTWTRSSISPPCWCSTVIGRPSRRARPPTPSRR